MWSEDALPSELLGEAVDGVGKIILQPHHIVARHVFQGTLQVKLPLRPRALRVGQGREVGVRVEDRSHLTVEEGREQIVGRGPSLISISQPPVYIVKRPGLFVEETHTEPLLPPTARSAGLHVLVSPEYVVVERDDPLDGVAQEREHAEGSI